MLTTEQNKLIGAVLPLLSDDRGSSEDIKKARELMSEWPDSMKEISEDIEETIFLIENDRSR